MRFIARKGTKRLVSVQNGVCPLGMLMDTEDSKRSQVVLETNSLAGMRAVVGLLFSCGVCDATEAINISKRYLLGHIFFAEGLDHIVQALFEAFSHVIVGAVIEVDVVFYFFATAWAHSIHGGFIDESLLCSDVEPAV